MSEGRVPEQTEQMRRAISALAPRDRLLLARDLLAGGPRSIVVEPSGAKRVSLEGVVVDLIDALLGIKYV